jgi:hypothetical protein
MQLDLNSLRDRQRLLIVSTPGGDDPMFAEQEQMLAAQASGLAERDLIVVRLFNVGTSRIGDDALDPDTSATIRERFAIASGPFSVTLVGKDGTVKQRYAQLFATIDAMPMRQAEMRQQQAGE